LKFDGCPISAKLAAHVARTDEKGSGTSSDEAPEHAIEDFRGPTSERVERASSVHPIGSAAGGALHDETERTRLIGDITRLLREPSMPENTRLAGLTLIGWLARRRPHESPHALGIEEARESERRIRAKVR
jgi:hypothetical protein